MAHCLKCCRFGKVSTLHRVELPSRGRRTLGFSALWYVDRSWTCLTSCVWTSFHCLGLTMNQLGLKSCWIAEGSNRVIGWLYPLGFCFETFTQSCELPSIMQGQGALSSMLESAASWWHVEKIASLQTWVGFSPYPDGWISYSEPRSDLCLTNCWSDMTPAAALSLIWKTSIALTIWCSFFSWLVLV